MIKKNSFTDKSFDLNNIAHYHLSLQVFLKGFSFSVLDRERNKFIALGNYTFDKISSYRSLLRFIEEIYQEEEEVLNQPYEHVKLIFATPKFSFVPSPFFSHETAETFFAFNHEKSRSEELMHNFIFSNSSYVIYALNHHLKEHFQSYYPGLKIFHQSSPLVEEILLKNKLQPVKTTVYLNIYPDFYDVALLKDGELVLYNSFVYTSITDFIYFILNTYNQLGLSQVEVPLIITGFINKNDEIIFKLRNYVKNIGFLRKPEHFDYSFDFNNIEEHHFTNLLNLYQCG